MKTITQEKITCQDCRYRRLKSELSTAEHCPGVGDGTVPNTCPAFGRKLHRTSEAGERTA